MPDDVPFSLVLVFWTLLLGALLLWYEIGRRRLIPGRAILEFEPRYPVPWGFLELLGIVFLCVSAESIAVKLRLGEAMAEGIDELPANKQADLMLYLSLAKICALALGLLFLRFRSRPTLADLGIRGKRLFGDIQLGVVSFLALAAPVYGIQGLLAEYVEPEHPIMHMLGDEAPVSFFLIAFFAAVIVAPIAEELVFRVFLQGWLENVLHLVNVQRDAVISDADRLSYLLVGRGVNRRATSVKEVKTMPSESTGAEDTVDTNRLVLGGGRQENEALAAVPSLKMLHAAEELGQIGKPTVLPIVISSVIFASLHWGQGPAPIPLFFLALGLGYLYQRTGRILPCIMLHMLLNGTTLLGLWLMRGS